MAELSAEQFAQRAFDLNLLSERQFQEIRGQVGSRQVSCEELQQILLRRDFLTNYQAERLLRGERTGYFYGDYKVLYLVGSGTFARVYRAVHGDNINDVVALKVLRRRFAEDHEQADRFYREGMMGATLRHPNIVPIREVYSQGTMHYLVMDFIEGRNLREFIKIRKKFETAEAVRLIIDVCSGLAYAFERGICHRDLKTSNVLLSSRGQAMLVDFGLAAADPNVADDASNSPNPRTIDYAGLERATGVRKDDQRSDLYFLGAILYHILTGVPPLVETRDRIQRLARTRYLNVAPIHQLDESIPRCVTVVVNRAMELNPADRYQSPGEMLVDLKIAARKIAENDTCDEEQAGGSARPARATSPTTAADSSQKTLMVVESNVSFQDLIRAKLKAWGYRVLVTRDPERAMNRFIEDRHCADCIIFSAGELGNSALEAFNHFATNEATGSLPAVLLLGKQQQDLTSQAKSGTNRVVVPISIKRGEFRELLARLASVDRDPKSRGAATA